VAENGNGINKWIGRAGTVLDLLSKISLTSLLFILLGLGIATYYGWLHSSLVTTEDLQEHNRITLQYFADRAKVDAEFIQLVRDMRTDMLRNSAAYRVRICSEIPERSVRDKCLAS